MKQLTDKQANDCIAAVNAISDTLSGKDVVLVGIILTEVVGSLMEFLGDLSGAFVQELLSQVNRRVPEELGAQVRKAAIDFLDSVKTSRDQKLD